MVGAPRFELGTSCAQGRRATRLRYAPTRTALLILKYFRIFCSLLFIVFGLDRALTVYLFRRNRSLDHDREHSFRRYRSCFAHQAVELLQGFALHLQLHLRILRHDLRVSLPRHLSHPFIRHSSITQPRSISGSKVVDPEIGDLCSAKRFAPNRLKVAWYPLGLRSLGKRNGLSGVIAIWRRNASAAKGVKGTSAMPFGVFESGIQTTALERSFWSLLIGASSL